MLSEKKTKSLLNMLTIIDGLDDEKAEYVLGYAEGLLQMQISKEEKKEGEE